MPRSTKPTEGGKRYPLNMRTTRELREKLEAAAAANGRSIAQEVETRLERSFHQQGLLAEVLSLAYGDRIARLLLKLRKATSQRSAQEELAGVLAEQVERTVAEFNRLRREAERKAKQPATGDDNNG